MSDSQGPKKATAGPWKPGETGNPAGRPAGIPNKRTLEAKALAERLGVDPLEVLLLFAGNKFGALYPEVVRKGIAEQGVLYEPPPIAPDLRIGAAKEAVKYLYSSLKSVEHAGDNGAGAMSAFLALPEARRHEMLEGMARRVLQLEDESLPPPDAGMEDDQ